MPGDQLDRDDLIRGLNAVIAKLRAAGQPAGIRIVGGAALALLGEFYPGDGLPTRRCVYWDRSSSWDSRPCLTRQFSHSSGCRLRTRLRSSSELRGLRMVSISGTEMVGLWPRESKSFGSNLRCPVESDR